MPRLTVSAPSASGVAAVDREWPRHRPLHYANLHWSWAAILRARPERFTVVDDTGAVFGLWCSAKYRPLRLLEGDFYRLDFIERDPRPAAVGLGAFIFALVSVRALELGCSGLVLASLPEAADFYERAGGERRATRGWRVSRSLVPFVFSAATLRELKERADGFQVEGS